eukprot:CAMPEP_0173439542 /NCGR_PEP_ID=MMETSP1357-20121228/21124_1 /TAXON_ID=77926 /ORGANISM="Hemiselmis rufescens, Strain PCC563" /LENGTH=55 /DNA_ID=CAMNT_0014404925 /DNA_START=90 /DNA_END=254 /DNA_ORIENTATION=+
MMRRSSSLADAEPPSRLGVPPGEDLREGGEAVRCSVEAAGRQDEPPDAQTRHTPT